MNRFFLGILLAALLPQLLISQSIIDKYGALIRSDTASKKVHLCITGHDFYEGFDHVLQVLKDQKVKASFFLTGDFIRNHKRLVKKIVRADHYVGAHSDKHLLYCDWSNRDSLLVAKDSIRRDISNNLLELQELGIYPTYFMPPYEWYNREIVKVAATLNQITVNFSPGTRSNADYTTPEMPNYIASHDILQSIYLFESQNDLNGFHLLIHPGTHPSRKDKLYLHLDSLIERLSKLGYQFVKF